MKAKLIGGPLDGAEEEDVADDEVELAYGLMPLGGYLRLDDPPGDLVAAYYLRDGDGCFNHVPGFGRVT